MAALGHHTADTREAAETRSQASCFRAKPSFPVASLRVTRFWEQRCRDNQHKTWPDYISLSDKCLFFFYCMAHAGSERNTLQNGWSRGADRRFLLNPVVSIHLWNANVFLLLLFYNKQKKSSFHHYIKWGTKNLLLAWKVGYCPKKQLLKFVRV